MKKNVILMLGLLMAGSIFADSKVNEQELGQPCYDPQRVQFLIAKMNECFKGRCFDFESSRELQSILDACQKQVADAEAASQNSDDKTVVQKNKKELAMLKEALQGKEYLSSEYTTAQVHW